MIQPQQLNRTTSRWWQVWQGPVLGTLTAVTCAVVLWAAIAPVITLIYAVFAFWALILIGIAWLTFAVLGWVLYRTARRSLIAPALVIVTAALVVLSVPFRVGFALSENRFTDLALKCQPSRTDQQVGVYTVQRTGPIGDSGCLFYTHGGFLDRVGVAYLPGGPTDGIRSRFESIEFNHVSGDWYRFSVGFD